MEHLVPYICNNSGCDKCLPTGKKITHQILHTDMVFCCTCPDVSPASVVSWLHIQSRRSNIPPLQNHSCSHVRLDHQAESLPGNRLRPIPRIPPSHTLLRGNNESVDHLSVPSRLGLQPAVLSHRSDCPWDIWVHYWWVIRYSWYRRCVHTWWKWQDREILSYTLGKVELLVPPQIL